MASDLSSPRKMNSGGISTVLCGFYNPAVDPPHFTMVLQSVAGLHRAFIPQPALDKSKCILKF
ncbi:hypothetical protein UP17_14175 [Peribacillus simplex]|nr:hypothetical protein UP17_14175 [Peribacillus simplex]